MDSRHREARVGGSAPRDETGAAPESSGEEPDVAER